MLKIEKNYTDGSTHTEYTPYDEIETTLRDIVFAELFDEYSEDYEIQLGVTTLLGTQVDVGDLLRKADYPKYIELKDKYFNDIVERIIAEIDLHDEYQDDILTVTKESRPLIMCYSCRKAEIVHDLALRDDNSAGISYRCMSQMVLKNNKCTNYQRRGEI